MQLAPEKYVTWDFWLTQDEQGIHHAFFLQGPRDNDNPEGRHNMASIGHSVSKDLKRWQYRGIAIERGAAGSWNDIANWTGNVIRTSEQDYMMMITGRSTQDAGRLQRLGLYYSKDLYSWRENPANPVLECDPEHYLVYDHVEKKSAWRDPFLYCENDQIYAFITAQYSKGGKTIGCIAIATAAEGHDWFCLPKLNLPDYFSVMECPVIKKHKNCYSLLINIDKNWVLANAPENVERVTGTHLLSATSLFGPYIYERCLLDGANTRNPSLWEKYQLVPADIDEEGRMTCVHWRGYQDDGYFLGGLSEPYCIDVP